MKTTAETELERKGLNDLLQAHAVVDGARMRYIRCGSGPNVVLLHGLLGYSFSWRFAIPALSQCADVCALDMMGTGFSDRPAHLNCTLRASAARTLRFLDEVGIASCDLIGTSHGGAVAMMAAALAPDRVRRLILVAPVNPWSTYGKAMAGFLSSRAVGPAFVGLAPRLEPIYGILLRRLYGDARRIRSGTLEGYSKPFRIPGAFNYGLNVLRSWKQDLKELESVLPRVATIPTLQIWGSLDKAVDPASAAPLQKQFKDCAVVTFDGVGHLPYEEVPEEFNRVVLSFLESTSVPLPRIIARPDTVSHDSA